MTILELELEEDLFDTEEFRSALSSGKYNNREEFISERAKLLLRRSIKSTKFTPRLKYYDRDKNVWVVSMKGESLTGINDNKL